MQELNQRLRQLEDDYNTHKIDTNSYHNRKIYILNQIQEYLDLQSALSAGSIDAQTFNQKTLEILNREESILNDYAAKTKKRKNLIRTIPLFIFLGGIILAFLVFEITRLSIIANNTIQVSSLKNIPEPVMTLTPDLPDINYKIDGENIRIERLASYTIRGKVLLRRYYYPNNIINKAAPVDLTIAWGEAADQSDNIQVVPANDRTVSYVFTNTAQQHLFDQISNNHLLYSDNDIRNKLLSIRDNQYIELEGYLVGVYTSGFAPWVSSLSLTDFEMSSLALGLGRENASGNCEIMYVTSVKWLSE